MAIVVTGATGNVGRPLVCRLAGAGARVRAITRSQQPSGFPAGVETVGTAIDALSGATAVFLNSRALGDGLADVVAAARRYGVGKLVALSAINADDDFSRQPSRFRGDRNKEVEHSRSTRAWSGSACGPRCSRRTSPGCGRRRSAPATSSVVRMPPRPALRSSTPTSPSI